MISAVALDWDADFHCALHLCHVLYLSATMLASLYLMYYCFALLTQAAIRIWVDLLTFLDLHRISNTNKDYKYSRNGRGVNIFIDFDDS